MGWREEAGNAHVTAELISQVSHEHKVGLIEGLHSFQMKDTTSKSTRVVTGSLQQGTLPGKRNRHNTKTNVFAHS